MTTPHFCLAVPRFSGCVRARVLPNHDDDLVSQTQGRPLDVVFGYDPTPISSVTPVWLRRSTPCFFVVHIRPQPVNDTRVVRSPARTLGSAVDGSFFAPFPAEVFHRFPQKRNFPVGVSQPFLHTLSGSSRSIDRIVIESMVTQCASRIIRSRAPLLPPPFPRGHGLRRRFRPQRLLEPVSRPVGSVFRLIDPGSTDGTGRH